MKCRQNVDELHPQTRNEKKEEDIEMNWGLFHNPYNNIRVLKDNSEHINILFKIIKHPPRDIQTYTYFLNMWIDNSYTKRHSLPELTLAVGDDISLPAYCTTPHQCYYLVIESPSMRHNSSIL